MLSTFACEGGGVQRVPGVGELEDVDGVGALEGGEGRGCERGGVRGCKRGVKACDDKDVWAEFVNRGTCARTEASARWGEMWKEPRREPVVRDPWREVSKRGGINKEGRRAERAKEDGLTN